VGEKGQFLGARPVCPGIEGWSGAWLANLRAHQVMGVDAQRNPPRHPDQRADVHLPAGGVLAWELCHL
jgi:hypothetical protein